MTGICFRIPEDMFENLKAIALTLDFSGYQPLIRAYIGQGLRKDLAGLENDQLELLWKACDATASRIRSFAEAITEVTTKTA